MAAPKVHIFHVEMTCEGCVNAISNVLKKHQDKGVNKFEVNLQDKTVTVTSDLPQDKILDIIKKTGKNTSYVGEGK